MSTQFKEIPAEEFEREHLADELREQRRADTDPRRKVSRYAEALDAFAGVAGYSPDLFKGLHVLLGKTRGKAPDEWVRFRDGEAGALLPGDADVTDSSKAKRWQRWCADFEQEQERTGKRVMRRVPGKKIVEKGTAKKLCSEYQSELAQIVIDVDRRSSQIRLKGLKRGEKLRMAALEVFAALPAYDAPPVKLSLVSPKEGQRPKPLAGNRSRALNRFLSAAKELLSEKKVEGEAAIDAEVARLHAELEALAAEMREQIEPEDTAVVHAGNTEWTENERIVDRRENEPEMVASNFSPKTQKGQQNRKTGEKILDTRVQYPEQLEDPVELAEGEGIVYAEDYVT